MAAGVLDAGVAPLPEGGRIDFARLRRERRQRLLEAMAAAGVDVVMLGRPANIAFASGARQLWTAGTRPFSPACVVVAATGRVHLLSTWDEGVPEEIGRRDLFGLSWNPAVATARLRAIDGLEPAASVATDGWGAGTADLVAALCPRASVGHAGPLLRAARLAKSPDELACLMVAAAGAEAALSALAAALRPGVTERELVGVYAERVASLAMPCPPSEAVAGVATAAALPAGRPRRFPTDRALAAGDLVALNPGASFAGYEVTVGRTRVVPGGAAPAGADSCARRARAALDAVIGACRPGASGRDLLEAWDRAGAGPLVEPLAWGTGLGMEAPVIGPSCGQRAAIRAGSVLAVQAWVFDAGAGGVLEQDVVVVGPEGPSVLTKARAGLVGAR